MAKNNNNGGGCISLLIVVGMIGGILSAIKDMIVENSTFFVIILAVIVFCGLAFWISGAFSNNKNEKIDFEKENRELKEQNFKLDSQVYQLEKDKGILQSQMDLMKKQLENNPKEIAPAMPQITLEEKYKKEYDYKKELEERIKELEELLDKIDNVLIEKHYNFKEYEDMTSEEVKTKMQLLEVEEQEMRQQNKDIIYNGFEYRKTEINKIIKKVLRTFNAECAIACQKITSKNIDKVRNEIQKSYTTINSLYDNDLVYISHSFFKLKLEKAELLYTLELKKQQEKEIQRAIREEIAKLEAEEKALRKQQEQINKDLQHHIQERNRTYKYLRNTNLEAEKELYIDKIRELEEKIKSLENDKKEISEFIENAKAGFVYIISNIGAFGEGIYKIGMTRRPDPLERIHELSSASVPFEFDVHATIFSSDAPALENMLHKHFADRAVNKINPRKEFFKVSLEEIEDFIKSEYDPTIVFDMNHNAEQYRQSKQMEEEEFMFWGD